MPLKIDHLKKSLDALVEVLAVSEDNERMIQLSHFERIAIRAGVVQHFEMTYELCWKLMARWLEENVSPDIAKGVTRRQLFRIAAEYGLIHDVDEWVKYNESRNDTTHIYDYERAELVYESIGKFIHDARDLVHFLETRNE